MTNTQATQHLERTEDYVIMKFRVTSSQELRRFLASAWMVSILTPQEIVELYPQEGAPRDTIEEELVEVGRD